MSRPLDDIPELRIRMTPETVRGGGAILSSLQGSEDPFAQREYYESLFTDLMDRLLEKKLAVLGSRQIGEDDSRVDN